MEWALTSELDRILPDSCLWMSTIFLPTSHPCPLPRPTSPYFFWIKIFIDTLCTYNYFTIIFFLTFILTLKQDYSAHYYQNSNSCHSSELLLVELHLDFEVLFGLLACVLADLNVASASSTQKYVLNACDVLWTVRGAGNSTDQRPCAGPEAFQFTRIPLASGLNLMSSAKICWSRVGYRDYKHLPSKGDTGSKLPSDWSQPAWMPTPAPALLQLCDFEQDSKLLCYFKC